MNKKEWIKQNIWSEQSFYKYLLQFLFTGITTANARLLGDTILQGLTRFEPRLSVDNINITTNTDEQQYIIDLIISAPSLNISNLEIKGTLAESGYYFN